ncbi:MAG: nucleoside triphosphate pyrophosphohydrolase [Myxococcota bacterium]
MTAPRGRDLAALLEIMARLRDPEGGCPWDLEQSFETIAPYTIEEAYEVDDAIARGDMEALCEELGDLLLQVVFHAQMAEEAGHFGFARVVEGICDKLVRRHPHVFGAAEVGSAEEQTLGWEEMKREEREERAARSGRRASALDGIAASLPALTRAQTIARRGRRIDPAPPSAVDAVRAATASLEAGESDAFGELLHACARWASERGVDAEAALRDCNRRVEARLRAREGEGAGSEER